LGFAALYPTYTLAQVRQPLYQQSVARWKNYEQYIGELIAGLENKSGLI
jgi:hypothetical protein